MSLRLLLLITLVCSMAGCNLSGKRANSNQNLAVQEASIKKPRSKTTLESIARVAYQTSDTESRVSEIAVAVESTNNETSDPSPSGAMTLEIIESMAMAINPAIQKAEAELASLKGKCVQVGLYPNPRGGVIGEDINDAGNAGRYGLFYSQKVVRSNRLELARKKVRAEIETKEIEIAELQQRLATDIGLAYYALLIANRKVELAIELVTVSQNAVQATSSLVDAQEVAVTAQLQAEVELQKAELNLRRSHNARSAARKQLAGFIDEEELTFENLDGSVDQLQNIVDLESKFQQILDCSPELNKLFAEVEVARRDLDHQCSLRIPDVTWQTGLAYDFGSDRWVPSFQIGLPLMKFNCNQGAIAQARSRVVVEEQEVEQKALQLRQRLVVSYRIYQDAFMQVKAIRQGILPKAKRTLELVSLGYEQGEVGFLDLLTAQRTFFTINQDYVNQLEVLWRQSILIEGMMLDQNLEQYE